MLRPSCYFFHTDLNLWKKKAFKNHPSINCFCEYPSGIHGYLTQCRTRPLTTLLVLSHIIKCKKLFVCLWCDFFHRAVLIALCTWVYLFGSRASSCSYGFCWNWVAICGRHTCDGDDWWGMLSSLDLPVHIFTWTDQKVISD